MFTSTQKDLVTQIIAAVAEAIRDSGPNGIPSGHLYAMLMGYMSLEQYQALIDLLVQSNVISRSNHVLYWNEAR